MDNQSNKTTIYVAAIGAVALVTTAYISLPTTVPTTTISKPKEIVKITDITAHSGETPGLMSIDFTVKNDGDLIVTIDRATFKVINYDTEYFASSNSVASVSNKATNQRDTQRAAFHTDLSYRVNSMHVKYINPSHSYDLNHDLSEYSSMGDDFFIDLSQTIQPKEVDRFTVPLVARNFIFQSNTKTMTWVFDVALSTSAGKISWREKLQVEFLKGAGIPLRVSEIREIQGILTQLGYKLGTIDGVIGNKTKRAVSQFKADHSIPVEFPISRSLLTILNIISQQITMVNTN